MKAGYKQHAKLLNFYRHILVTDNCWIWEGGKDKDGYGHFSRTLGNLTTSGRAHRISYEIVFGIIEDGLTLDHLCCVRACVNPLHLEPVTQLENMRRSRLKFCKRGHEYTDANTYTCKSGRKCRSCIRHHATLRAARRSA